MPNPLARVKEITRKLGQLEFVKAFFAAADDPNNTQNAFALQAVMINKISAEERVAASKLLREHPASRQLIAERYLAPHYTTAELAHYQPGSLGYAYYRHLHDNGFDPDFIPPLKDKVQDDLTYFVARQSQLHDIWHVLAGFAPSMDGEIGLQAFTLAQMPAPAFAATMVSGGLLYGVLHNHALLDPAMEAISMGWRNGKAAHSLLAGKWEEQWERPLAELRREYNITPYSAIYDFAPQTAAVA